MPDELQHNGPSALLRSRGFGQTFPACPHCKEGGKVIIGKYVSISIYWDAENGYWHCLICGFIGFGTDVELLQYPLVACVGHAPRLPGTPRKRKIKSRL